MATSQFVFCSAKAQRLSQVRHQYRAAGGAADLCFTQRNERGGGAHFFITQIVQRRAAAAFDLIAERGERKLRIIPVVFWFPEKSHQSLRFRDQAIVAQNRNFVLWNAFAAAASPDADLCAGTGSPEVEIIG